MPCYGAIVAQFYVRPVPPSRLHNPRASHALQARLEQSWTIVDLSNGRTVDLCKACLPDRGPRRRPAGFGVIVCGWVIGRDRACDQGVLLGEGIVMTAALLGRNSLVVPDFLFTMLLAVVYEVVVINGTSVEKARGPFYLVARVQTPWNTHDRRDVAEQPELPVGPPGALGYPLRSIFPDYRAPSQMVMGHLTIVHEGGQELDQTDAR